MLTIKKFECNMFSENCYVVSDETKECMIVDCGALYEAEQNAIETYIRENELKPVVCALTHAHVDHIFGVRFICDRYNLKPVLREKDMPLYEGFQTQAQQMCGMDVDYSMPSETVFVEENDEVKFGTHAFRVIETPGHSRGSIFYYCEEEKVMFSGDTLFRGSIGRTDLPGGSMFQIIQSLRMITQYPDDTKVYSGHGPETTIGYELATNMYLDR